MAWTMFSWTTPATTTGDVSQPKAALFCLPLVPFPPSLQYCLRAVKPALSPPGAVPLLTVVCLVLAALCRQQWRAGPQLPLQGP